MPDHVVLPSMFDAHVHFRQGAILPSLVQAHRRMGCDAVVAMPNTSPPLTRVFGSQEDARNRSIEGYLREVAAADGGFSTTVVPLYATGDTTPAMIRDGARAGVLKSVKYYPPKGTNNSEFGVPMRALMAAGVLDAMQEHGVVLNVHGEAHGLPGHVWMGRATNAETIFYADEMEAIKARYPGLRVVCEHVTTEQAAAFVRGAGPNFAATVTPQHLLYTRGDLVQGWFAHLNCMPVPKDIEDVEALRAAVTAPGNASFFAGTDSAPHPALAKSMDCGCAFGCFTGGIAPQLYARAFEAAGSDPTTGPGREAFVRFTSANGRAFYGLTAPTGTYRLSREPETVVPLETPAGRVVPLPVGLVRDTGAERQATLEWRVGA